MSSRRWAISLLLTIVTQLSAADPVPRVDLLGDPLPTGAIARIGSSRFLPRPYLENVYFTPDGSTVIGRGGSNILQFWEAQTGKTIFELRDPELVNFRSDQSPDGTRLALFGHDKRGKPAPDTMLRVYDVVTRKPLWSKVIDDEYHYYFAVRYSLDGNHIITGTNLGARVWDAKTGVEIRHAKTAVSYGGLTLSPDGKTVAIVNELGLHLWDWNTDSPTRKADTRNRRYVNPFVFSPDGKTVFSYSDDAELTIHGYDVATGAFTGKANKSVMTLRTTSPNGKTVAISDCNQAKLQGSVILQDAATGKEICRLSTGKVTIVDARWSNDGSRLAGATSYRAFVWDVKSGEALGPSPIGHTSRITSLNFTSDGRLITNSEDRTIRSWDPTTGKERAQIVALDHQVWTVVASPDGSLLAASQGANEARVWDSKSGAELFKLRWSTSRTGGVHGIQFSNDGQSLLTYGTDFYVRIFDLATGKLKLEHRIRPDWAFGTDPNEDEMRNDMNGFLSAQNASLGADGNTLALGSGKNVSVYSLDSGKERYKLAADEQQVLALVLSPDGKRMATMGLGPVAKAQKGGPPTDSQITIWNVAEAKQLSRFRSAGRNNYGVLAFTPDGSRIVTGSADETLRFWDAATGKLDADLELPRAASRITFTPDGKLMAVALSDPTVLIYDVNAALKRAKE